MVGEIKTLEERKNKLLALGRKQGFVTYEQLADELKGLDVDSDTLDDLYNRVNEGELKELNLVIRADSTGSCEALKSSLSKIQVEGVKINIIRATAGAISESDVLLASASNAIIYGFNVRPDSFVKAKALEEAE